MRAIVAALNNKLFHFHSNLRTITTTMSGGSNQTSAFNRPRMVAKTVLAKLQHEGDGALVRRAIGRYINLQHTFICFMYCITFFVVDDIDFCLCCIGVN